MKYLIPLALLFSLSALLMFSQSDRIPDKSGKCVDVSGKVVPCPSFNGITSGTNYSIGSVGSGTNVAVNVPPDMMIPKVTHHDEVTTQHSDVVDRDCPTGYEAHLVDTGIGFWGDVQYFGQNGTVFTICFKKEFMEKVRSNKDLVIPRPILRGA